MADFSWSAEHVHAKVFLLYLSYALCVTVVRSLRAGIRLYSFGDRQAVSYERLLNGAMNSDQFADAALSNRVTYQSVGVLDSSEATRSAAFRTLRRAEIRFAYLWEKNYSSVAASRRLVSLTFLVSLLFVSVGVSGILDGRFLRPSDTTPMLSLVLESISGHLARFSVGIVFCILLHIFSRCLENAFHNRATEWNYLRARLKEDLGEEQQGVPPAGGPVKTLHS